MKLQDFEIPYLQTIQNAKHELMLNHSTSVELELKCLISIHIRIHIKEFNKN